MASLQQKTIHGKKYWYIVESRRVNGKPRPVVLAYLGKAEDLLRRITGGAHCELQSKAHGAVQVIYEFAQSLGIYKIINKHVAASSFVPMRDGLSVGETLLFAAIGRACKPTSKMGWHEWCKDTSLEYLAKKPLKKLDSQHFWDQMHTVPVSLIPEIEREIVQAISKVIPLSTEDLFFDTTNFFTFIDSSNKRCDLPQRGHNKQKRMDLRQISLALLVTGKDHIPLFHHLYEGNKNDITAFKETLPLMITRLKELGLDSNQVTLLFDKGNNSKNNFALIDQANVHFVGSLSLRHFPSLVTKANKLLSEVLINEVPVQAFKTQHTVWGKERTCVVCISEELLAGQLQGIYQSLQKAKRQLEALQQKLSNPKSRYTYDQVMKRAAVIKKSQYLQAILIIEVIGEKGSLHLRYSVDTKKLEALKNSVLGRQILVTDRKEWTTQQIIQGYQRKTKIEYAFRCLKDHDHLALRPQFHWTDQKISVHAFICMLAFLLSTTLFAKARKEAGYEKDLAAFLDDLNRIRLVTLMQPALSGKGRHRISYKLEKFDKTLLPLIKLFNIKPS